MIRTYILEGHTAVPCDDLVRVGELFGITGLLPGPPLLFETMVFGGPMDLEQRRYSTWEEAEAGHAEIVKKVEGRGSEASPYKRQ